MAALHSALYEFFRGHLVEVAVSLVLLYLIPKLLASALQQWRIYCAFKPIPCDPDQHFLFGHAPRMMSDMGKVLDWCTDIVMEKRWKVMKLALGPGKNILVGMHPDVLKTMAKSDPKSDELFYPILPWLGRSLLTSNGAKWARSRRLLTPAFHYDILRPYVKVYGEAVNELVGMWAKIPERESFNAFPYINHLTLDIMLRCSCSHRSNCQVAHSSHSPYIRAVHALSDLTVRRFFTFYKYFDLVYFLTPDYWCFKKNCKIVHDFAMNIIRQRRKELEKCKKVEEAPKRKYRDFIDILLEAKDDSGVGLTDMEIRSEVDTFVFEGHDTTASSIIWTLYNLALHPEHQQICRKEADDIFDQKDFIETEDLKSLEYLKYCIKESMRLFPPVPFTGRILAQDTEIGGYTLPKGTSVASCVHAVHRHPDHWENPQDFEPLRFTPDRSKGRHPHAFLPFSAGPRNCIGQEFALNEEKVVLATILRNFEISLDKTKVVSKEFLLILRPKGGLYLKLKRRESDMKDKHRYEQTIFT